MEFSRQADGSARNPPGPNEPLGERPLHTAAPRPGQRSRARPGLPSRTELRGTKAAPRSRARWQRTPTTRHRIPPAGRGLPAPGTAFPGAEAATSAIPPRTSPLGAPAPPPSPGAGRQQPLVPGQCRPGHSSCSPGEGRSHIPHVPVSRQGGRAGGVPACQPPPSRTIVQHRLIRPAAPPRSLLLLFLRPASLLPPRRLSLGTGRLEPPTRSGGRRQRRPARPGPFRPSAPPARPPLSQAARLPSPPARSSHCILPLHSIPALFGGDITAHSTAHPTAGMEAEKNQRVRLCGPGSRGCRRHTDCSPVPEPPGWSLKPFPRSPEQELGRHYCSSSCLLLEGICTLHHRHLQTLLLDRGLWL